MSIQGHKVILDTKHKSRKGFVWLLGAAEIVLTVVLGLVIATTKIFSPNAESAAGVINKLSYQGRLTDTSGNALGGTGTNYCFRFSIYDAASAGNKIWPTGTPVSSTLSVVSGVFNAEVGTADTLDYNFYPTSTAYLNVEVSNSTSTCTEATLEDLEPRQQILATGYAIAAENVYGDLIRTDVASSIVQIGTGAGVSSSSVKKLALDVANTGELLGASCSANGTIWYNSSASNSQALICENGIIRPVVDEFVTNYYPVTPISMFTSSMNSGATGAGTNVTASFYLSPMVLDHAVSYSRINALIASNTVAGTGSLSIARYVGLYTLNGGTAFSRLSSFMFRQEISQNSISAHSQRFYWGTNSTSNSSSSGGNITASYTGTRVIPMWTGATSLSAGKYWLAIGQVNVSNGSNLFSASQFYASFSSTSIGGQLGSAVTLAAIPMMGLFSSTTTMGDHISPFMPASIHTSVITNTGGSSQWRSNYIQLVGSQF